MKYISNIKVTGRSWIRKVLQYCKCAGYDAEGQAT